MGEGLMGHVLVMIRNTLFRKKDPTTPQHISIWAVYPPYVQHQRPPQPYFTSLHGTHTTSGKVETFSPRTYRRRPRSRPGAQRPSSTSASSAAFAASNWWVVYPWKIGADSRVILPHSASCGWMLRLPRAGGSCEWKFTCVPACARPPGVGGDQDSGVRECKLY